MDFPYRDIEKKIGYVFQNKTLLKTAFTHSSYSNTYGGKHNERLEYLGDAVLQLVVTEWQFLREPTVREGKLTAERQKLVCRDALDSAIDALDVWRYLLNAGGEDNVGDKAKSSLFEALTAAIYLDGGYERAKAFVYAHGNLGAAKNAARNSIGELKEYLESLGKSDAEYAFWQSGKAHAPYFKCEAYALGETATGEGKTKKEAKATAAARLLCELTGGRPVEPIKERKRAIEKK